MSIMFMIVTLMYMIMLGAFSIYKSKAEKKRVSVRKQLPHALVPVVILGQDTRVGTHGRLLTVPIEYIH